MDVFKFKKDIDELMFKYLVDDEDFLDNVFLVFEGFLGIDWIDSSKEEKVKALKETSLNSARGTILMLMALRRLREIALDEFDEFYDDPFWSYRFKMWERLFEEKIEFEDFK